MFAAHARLDNLVAIIDYNKLQSLASTEETLGLEPLADKIRAFNWNVIEVDGHDHEALKRVLDEAADHRGRPTAIPPHTTKGKGVSLRGNPRLRPPNRPDQPRVAPGPQTAVARGAAGERRPVVGRDGGAGIDAEGHAATQHVG